VATAQQVGEDRPLAQRHQQAKRLAGRVGSAVFEHDVDRVAGDPVAAFGLASAIGLVGVAYFALFGEEYGAYA